MRIRHLFALGPAAGVIGVALCGAGVANATAPPMEFGFQKLQSAYDSSTSTLTVRAADEPGFFSMGQMRRSMGPGELLVFDEGFVSEANPSDFQITLHITPLTPTTALAEGPMMITDVDGDTFSAVVNGLFEHDDGVSSLYAALTTLAFSSDEELFDGPDGGTFSTNFPPGSLALGTLRLSFIDGPRSFDSSFEDAETGLVGWVPSPSGAGLLALAGLAAARRRRTA